MAPTPRDMEVILADSNANQYALEMVSKLVQLHRVETFSFAKLHKDLHLELVTTASNEELLAYYRLGIWRYDIIFNPDYVRDQSVIDYAAKLNIPLVQEYTTKIKQRITLLSEFNVLGCKHTFMYNMNREKYYSLSETEKHKLGTAMFAASKLLLSLIRFNTQLVISEEDIRSAEVMLQCSNKKSPGDKTEEIKKMFNLTEIELEYLKILTTGCTAKEIALQLDKSHRYIEKITQNLKQKFQIHSKNQFENIAQIITASF